MKEIKTLISSSEIKDWKEDDRGNFWTLIIFKSGGSLLGFFSV